MISVEQREHLSPQERLQWKFYQEYGQNISWMKQLKYTPTLTRVNRCAGHISNLTRSTTCPFLHNYFLTSSVFPGSLIACLLFGPLGRILLFKPWGASAWRWLLIIILILPTLQHSKDIQLRLKKKIYNSKIIKKFETEQNRMTIKSSKVHPCIN